MEFCYHKVENNEVDIYIHIPSSKQVNDYKFLLHAKETTISSLLN